MFTRLSETVHTLYADLLQKARLPQQGLSGCFVSKKVKGKTYWYHQSEQLDGRRQRYLGVESEALLAEMAAHKLQMQTQQTLLGERRRLVAMLGVAGAHLEKGRPAQIIKQLAEIGLFDAGGIMIGSFAFACYSNMLGIQTDQALHRTQDIDFSVERNMTIAVQRDLATELQLAAPDLHLTQPASPHLPAFGLVAADGFKVEFFTTKQQPSDKQGAYIESLGIHAHPLEFMDFLLEETQAGVVLHGAGILVNLPNPARFALHKLAISQLRPVADQAKINKDKQQAVLLLQVLLEDNPGTLLLAWDSMLQREDGLGFFALQALRQLPIKNEIAALLGGELPQIKLDTSNGKFGVVG